MPDTEHTEPEISQIRNDISHFIQSFNDNIYIYINIARKSGKTLLCTLKEYTKRMFPVFRAIVTFCSTNRLFTYT